MPFGPLELMIILLYAVIPGVIVGTAANRRGRNGWGWGLLAAIFGPLGLLLLFLLPRSGDGLSGREDPNAPMSDARLDRLQRLAEARDSGALTPEQFEAERSKVLDTY